MNMTLFQKGLIELKVNYAHHQQGMGSLDLWEKIT